jgi:serine/threonine-protein kinase HipA
MNHFPSGEEHRAKKHQQERVMAKREEEQLWVWLDDPAFGPLQQIGTLSRGARGTVRFVYEPAWLKQVNAFPLDPELDLSAGDFFPGSSNFGVFMDSCPDRWGQLLMKRREAIEAKEEERTPRALDPWDFLLGVQDCTRMGALRFSRPGKSLYLANEALSAPPVAKIAELQEVAFELNRKKQDDLGKIKEWLTNANFPGEYLSLTCTILVLYQRQNQEYQPYRPPSGKKSWCSSTKRSKNAQSSQGLSTGFDQGN